MEALYSSPPPTTPWDLSWPLQSKSSSSSSSSSSSRWTREENKRFESALAMFDEKTPQRWLKVAAMIPGKSVSDVIQQYMALVADVTDIEAGLVPDPGYISSSSFTVDLADHRGFDPFRKRGRSYDHERKKGVPWTEEEHRLFLLGLLKYGKGDWRNISRNFVITKTPTQVASHAQKYFLRQQISAGKDKRRPSIHDITTGHVTRVSSDRENSMNQTEKSVPTAAHQKTNWSSHHDGGASVALDAAACSTIYLNDIAAARQCFRAGCVNLDPLYRV